MRAEIAQRGWMLLGQLTERTEVLADLWIDLAAAYAG
jgi:hypothetical protein